MPQFEHDVYTELSAESLHTMQAENGLLSAGRDSQLLRTAPVWSRALNLQESARKSTTSTPFRVVDPLSRPQSSTGRGGSRFSVDNRDAEYGSQVIFRAKEAEALIQQVVNKFTDLINKKGFNLRSLKKEPEIYLQERLFFIGRCQKESFAHLTKELSRDYVTFGNAFLVKVYEKNKTVRVKGHSLKTAADLHGDPERGVVVGYFRVDPRQILPRYDKRNGRHNGWIHKVDNKEKTFSLDDIIHFAYQRPASDVLGISMIKCVLDDFRAMRDDEEYALKLYEKLLFPIVHHKIPARGDDQFGTQEEMDQAAYGYSGIAPDGILITPPGHEIEVLGAAGEALDPTPFLEYLQKRVFAGLGVSGTIMGTDPSSAASSDVLTTQMHDRVKSFQQDLQEGLNLHVIYELLLEAGYDPSEENEAVWLEFNDIEEEDRIRAENHATLQFTNGILTEDEARAIAKLNPLTGAERKKKQIYTDQIPILEIEHDQNKELTSHEHGETRQTNEHGHKLAKDLASHTHKINKDAISHEANVQKDLVKSGVAPTAQQQIKLASIKATADVAKAKAPPKPKVRSSASRKSSGAKRSLTNKVNPSNQHGSRGVARASKTPAAGHASKRTPRSAQRK